MKALEDFVAIDLEVTSVCNAVCGFCPRDVMPDKKSFMSLEVVERLADEFRANEALRGKLVVLCGIGESTLHPHLDDIAATLAGAGAQVAMTTHGGRMTKKRFEQLVARGMSSFNFSLNAVTGETHQRVMRLRNYEQIAANLEEILEVRRRAYPHILVHVSFVVCNHNHQEVVDFVNYWKSRDVSQVWLHPVNNRAGLLSPDVRSVDVRPFAAKYAGDNRVVVDIFEGQAEEEDICKIARSLIFISVDGEMRLCAMDYRRETSHGNLMENGLRQMHVDKLLGFVRGEMDEFCGGCDFCPSGITNRNVTITRVSN